MKKILSLIALLIFTACSTTTTSKLSSNSQDLRKYDLYDEAQKEFNKRNYKESLEYFKKFVEANKHLKDKKRVFWSIDQIGRIYLRIQKDPAKAINYFEKVLSSIRLSDADEDNIQEWISAAKEWKKLGRMPKQIKKSSELFFLGEKFYKQAMEKIDYPADDSGNADFYIAATYLVPYVFNYDDGKYIGKALFMLGNIRFRSWNDYEYWTENFYLKEVIRRFPNSELSWKAYKVLKNGIHAGYTGSGGDSTPPSQIRQLKRLEKIAKPR